MKNGEELGEGKRMGRQTGPFLPLTVASRKEQTLV